MSGPDAFVPLPGHVVSWHFGSLHPYESVLALLLAFGPFVVLAIVIALRRRESDEEDEVSGS